MMPNKRYQEGQLSSQRGIALIVAILALLLFSALVGGMFVLAHSEILSTSSYKQAAQASYLAEAGINKALEWLQYTFPTLPSSSFNDKCYPVVQSGAACSSAPILLSAMQGTSANYPDASVQTSFQDTLKDKPLGSGPYRGTYAVTAKLLRSQGGFSKPGLTWEVVARGTTTSGVIAEVKAIVTQFPVELPKFAALSCATGPASLTIGNTSSGVVAGTDSYDSNVGPYGGANVGSQGNVGSNGQYVQDGGVVNGNAQFASTVGAGTVTGTSSAVPSVYDCSKIPLPTTSPGTTDIIYNGGTHTLTPGSYRNVLCTSACTLNVLPGTYNVNSFEVDSGSTINISGATLMNVVGTSPTPSSKAVYLDSNTLVNPGPPADFVVMVNRSDPVIADSGVSARYVMIAPLSKVVNDSNTDTYGMVIGKTIVQDSGARIHYDIALQRLAMSFSGVKVVSWSQGTF